MNEYERLDAYRKILDLKDKDGLKAKCRHHLTYAGRADRHKTITPKLHSAFLAYWLLRERGEA
jgi:hypothetical protein